jgi:hypothetical protein
MVVVMLVEIMEDRARKLALPIVKLSNAQARRVSCVVGRGSPGPSPRYGLQTLHELRHPCAVRTCTCTCTCGGGGMHVRKVTTRARARALVTRLLGRPLCLVACRELTLDVTPLKLWCVR